MTPASARHGEIDDGARTRLDDLQAGADIAVRRAESAASAMEAARRAAGEAEKAHMEAVMARRRALAALEDAKRVAAKRAGGGAQ